MYLSVFRVEVQMGSMYRSLRRSPETVGTLRQTLQVVEEESDEAVSERVERPRMLRSFFIYSLYGISIRLIKEDNILLYLFLSRVLVNSLGLDFSIKMKGR